MQKSKLYNTTKLKSYRKNNVTMRTDYPYDLAISDLREFLARRVTHSNVLSEFQEELDSSLKRKTVPMRFIFEKFIKYTNEHKQFVPYTKDEEDMIDDLFHFWG